MAKLHTKTLFVRLHARTGLKFAVALELLVVTRNDKFFFSLQGTTSSSFRYKERQVLLLVTKNYKFLLQRRVSGLPCCNHVVFKLLIVILIRYFDKDSELSLFRYLSKLIVNGMVPLLARNCCLNCVAE